MRAGVKCLREIYIDRIYLFGNYVIFKRLADAREMAILYAPPRRDSTVQRLCAPAELH